jgi:L-rhamnose mutarotase
MRNIRKWTKKEEEYLKKNYLSYEMSKISKDLDRSISSITNKAFVLGLKNRNNKLSNLNKLLNETNESYYWIGFFMADGHFNKNGQIQINLSIKDLHHLIRFASFIEYKKELNTPRLSVSDKEVVSLIKEKFNLTNNKTYNPPILNINDEEKMFSLIVGFIDGDGYIDKKGYLSIKIHKSWKDVLEKMLINLVGYDNYSIYLNSGNLVIGCVKKIELTKKVKKRVIELNLPVLIRKWENIDFNKLSKQERRNSMDAECFSLFENGNSPTEVISKTKFSSSFVYTSFNRWNNIDNKVD